MSKAAIAEKLLRLMLDPATGDAEAEAAGSALARVCRAHKLTLTVGGGAPAPQPPPQPKAPNHQAPPKRPKPRTVWDDWMDEMAERVRRSGEKSPPPPPMPVEVLTARAVVLTFGQHRGMTVGWVAERDWDFLEWMTRSKGRIPDQQYTAANTVWAWEESRRVVEEMFGG